MPIGLKRGVVKLADHDPEWEGIARETIGRLWRVFGTEAMEMQHVGSTAVRGIQAKPIIDIAVAVENFSVVEDLTPALEAEGFLRRKWENDEQLLFACGDYSKPDGEQTHFIHVVKAGGTAWRDYLNFRDYLNARPSVARAYEALKVKLANENPDDRGREKYLAGKFDFIRRTLREALVWRYLGTTVTVTIDRPIGSVHPTHSQLVYPINYGYIAGEIAPDGEELDAYVLGVDVPVAAFTGRVIGIINRQDDVEDKLVVAPEGTVSHQNEIAEAVYFQERFFHSTISCLNRKSAGMIVCRRTQGALQVLLLFQRKSQTWSFPKGHMEAFETEEQTAVREVKEETGLALAPIPGFRAEISYPLNDWSSKTVVLFLAESDGAVTIRENEIAQYRWVGKAEACSLLQQEGYPQILDDAERWARQRAAISST